MVTVCPHRDPLQADGNERRLSPAFLELERRKALYQNLEVMYTKRMCLRFDLGHGALHFL